MKKIYLNVSYDSSKFDQSKKLQGVTVPNSTTQGNSYPP
jgi:hypothetical protein